MTGADDEDRMPRRPGVVGLGIVALAVVAIGIFVLPFALPTRPPVAGQLKSDRWISPNGDRIEDVAAIGFRMNKAGALTVRIADGERVVRTLAEERRLPQGPGSISWDGRDDSGRPVPDGEYDIDFRAVATRTKQRAYDVSRAITVDTQAPGVGELQVRSAALDGPGAGECRVDVRPADEAGVLIRIRTTGGREITTRGPIPVEGGGRVRWQWNGREDGVPVPAGTYLVRVRLSDRAGNRQSVVRSCWVGHLLGRARPVATSERGRTYEVRLTDLRGRAIPRATPVRLRLHRVRFVPGTTAAGPLGRRVATSVGTRAGTARILVPASVRPGPLWIVARTRDGQALIEVPR